MHSEIHGREPKHVTTNGNIGWIANYIWGIANDVLRDLYVRGKYRDVILPMTVLRRAGRGPGGQQAGSPRHEGVP